MGLVALFGLLLFPDVQPSRCIVQTDAALLGSVRNRVAGGPVLSFTMNCAPQAY